MAEVELKSTAFRREREASWRRLEEIVGHAEKSGIEGLSAADTMRLPSLYRATLSGLSVARAISLDRNLLQYLEVLSTRAYLQVYAVRKGFVEAVVEFFLRRFPAAVRAATVPIAIASVVMALGSAIAYLAVLNDMNWFYSFLPPEMAQGRSPTTSTEALREILFDSGDGAVALNVFATFLFTHNAKIGLLAFALGFAFGAPVLLLMFYNGLLLGALAALYGARDLGIELWGWLLIHGTTELLAVGLCGGAGLVLGGALLFPTREGRLAALARRGRQAAEITIGAVAMFAVAGLLEGFGRQLIQDTVTRYLIGGAALAIWLAYFALAGRGAAEGK